MKGLRALFGGKATTRNTALLSTAKMQALGVLQIYLEHTLEKPCILTQVAIAVTPPEPDAAGVHCQAFVEAFFYWPERERKYGHEGAAPLPPKIVASIRMRSGTSGRTFIWESPRVIEATVSNVRNGSFTFKAGQDDFDFVLEAKILAFTRGFNDNRAWGFAAMPTGHDQVIWNINPLPGVETH